MTIRIRMKINKNPASPYKLHRSADKLLYDKAIFLIFNPIKNKGVYIKKYKHNQYVCHSLRCQLLYICKYLCVLYFSILCKGVKLLRPIRNTFAVVKLKTKTMANDRYFKIPNLHLERK